MAYCKRGKSFIGQSAGFYQSVSLLPRYTQREVQVSATTTSVSPGRAGLSRSQIQTAMFSLVGASQPEPIAHTRLHQR